jgi:hypothetical protein
VTQPARDAVRGGGSARAGFAATLLLAAALCVPYRGYLTDDTFIHLQFAKHVSRGEGFAFNRGEPTYGATSPLWVGFLALAGRAGVPVEAPGDPESMPPLAWVAKLMGGASVLLAVWLLGATAGRLGWEPGPARVAAGFLALHAWSARWALSGMETPLAVACVGGSLYLLARRLRVGTGSLPLGLLLGVGGLVRPELHLLALLVLASVAAGARERRGRSVLAVAAGYALVTLPWLALSSISFHRLLPNTAAAKAGAWLDPDRMYGALKAAAEIFLSTDALPIGLFLVLVGTGGAAAAARDRPRRAFFLVAALWPLALVFALAATGTQIVSRYLLPAVPCVLLLGVGALRRLTSGLPPSRARLAFAAALLLYAAPNLYLTFRIALPSAVAHTRGLRDSLISIGLWARARTDPGAEFALPDIGAFGYYSDRRVLDLFGLVTPAMAPIVIRAGYDTVVREVLYEEVGRPGYLIDRAAEPDRLGRPGGEPRPYRFLFARAIPNLGVTRAVRYVYSVYEIDWRSFEETHSRTAMGRGLEPSRRIPYNMRTGRQSMKRGGRNYFSIKQLPPKARVATEASQPLPSVSR